MGKEAEDQGSRKPKTPEPKVLPEAIEKIEKAKKPETPRFFI